MIQDLKSSSCLQCAVVTMAIVYFLSPAAAVASSASFSLPANVDTSMNGGTSIGNSANGVNYLSSNLVNVGVELINNTAGNVYGTDGDIRFVISVPMVSVQFENSGPSNYAYNGSAVVAVMALDGLVTHFTFQSALVERYQITSGRVGFFATSQTFSSNNPLTWGSTDASGTVLSKPIAVWDLKSPEPVVQISSAPLFNPVNQGVHFVNVHGDDNLLFRETQSPSFSSGAGVLSGNDYISLTKNSIPPNFVFQDEGLAMRIINDGFSAPNAGSPWNGGLGVPAFDALNTIACQLGGLNDLDTALGGCQGFANGFGGVGNAGGDGRSYNPGFALSATGNTADMEFHTSDAFAIPTAQADQVPEPASGILLLIASAGLLAWRGGRSLLQKQRHPSARTAELKPPRLMLPTLRPAPYTSM